MAMSSKSMQQQPTKQPEPTTDVDVVAALPKAPSNDSVDGKPVCMQVRVPNYHDAPDHLKKRFLEFGAPMGHGPALRSPTDPAYVKECREFLVTHEWEEVYPGMWRDPLSAGGYRGEKVLARMLPEKDGSDRPLMQLRVPPAERLWGTEEAVGMVRTRLAREEAAANPSLIERLDRASGEIADLRRRNADLVNDLAQIRRRPIPNTVDALKAELAYVRRKALAAADALKAEAANEVEAA